AVHDLALLVERRLLGDLVVRAVKVIDILRDRLALRVLPGPRANPVPRMDGRGAVGRLRAEIGAPRSVARAGGLGQRLAGAIGPVEAPQVAALAGSRAGDEEAHVRRLRGRIRGEAQGHESRRCDDRNRYVSHGYAPHWEGRISG